MARWTEVWAGIGLGALVGLLMSLSVASVVGGVVAALAAALGAFLGLVPAGSSDRGLRIGAFGLACAGGVLGGLSVRTGAAGLAPSVSAEVKAWTEAGYPPDEARALVAFQRLGIRPAGREVGAPPAPGPAVPVLFSVQGDLCGMIGRLQAPEVLQVLRGPTGGDTGAAIVAAIVAAPPATQPELVGAFRRSLCGL